MNELTPTMRAVWLMVRCLVRAVSGLLLCGMLRPRLAPIDCCNRCVKKSGELDNIVLLVQSYTNPAVESGRST